MYMLNTMYDTRASFYGKAMVNISDDGNEKNLFSYGTKVATIYWDKKEQTKKARVYGQYSQTTTRHQKEFLKQNGFKADTIKQVLNDYMEGLK